VIVAHVKVMSESNRDEMHRDLLFYNDMIFYTDISYISFNRRSLSIIISIVYIYIFIFQHGVGVEFVRVLPETHPPTLSNIFCECNSKNDVVRRQYFFSRSNFFNNLIRKDLI